MDLHERQLSAGMAKGLDAPWRDVVALDLGGNVSELVGVPSSSTSSLYVFMRGISDADRPRVANAWRVVPWLERDESEPQAVSKGGHWMLDQRDSYDLRAPRSGTRDVYARRPEIGFRCARDAGP